MSQRLPDVIEEYERSRLYSQGLGKNTMRNERSSLDRLLAEVGPVQVRHLTERHVDAFLAAMQARGHSAGTMNIHLQTLRNFFNFCTRRGYLKTSPVEHRRKYRSVPRQRLRVPAEKFPALLENAGHPRDRILVATGLFLWLRSSEAVNLTVGDVNLSDGEITVRIYKTKQLDVMPISYEYDQELRRWLAFYAADLGEPLRPDMYLIPSKSRPRDKDPVTGQFLSIPGEPHLRPYARMTNTALIVKNILTRSGYPVRDDGGRSTMEGMHTLRRSGARARFDFLVSQGYDGAIKEVQAGLHHASVQTTERYIGIDLDAQRRYVNIKGNLLYGDIFKPQSGGNVVYLGGGGEQEDGPGRAVRRLRHHGQADDALADGAGDGAAAQRRPL